MSHEMLSRVLPSNMLCMALVLSALLSTIQAFSQKPPSTFVGRRICAATRTRGRQARSRQIQLHGSTEQADFSKYSKLSLARKLLEDSRLAFAESRNTRSEDIRIGTAWGFGGNRTVARDLHAEFRIQAQWSRAGRALYGTWIKVFGGAADVQFASDPLGLEKECNNEEICEDDLIREAFERLDIDQSGTIDQAELEAMIRNMTGSTPDESTLRLLLSEATLYQQGTEESTVISRQDFSGPMRALLDQKRTLALATELAEAGKRELSQVVDALKEVSEEGLLVGGSQNATQRLDKLSSQGILRVWNTGKFVKEAVSAKRMESEMALTIRLENIEATYFSTTRT